jgi:uncharacterized RDD family membrane protein YckC
VPREATLVPTAQRDLFPERPVSNVIPFETRQGGGSAAVHPPAYVERPPAVPAQPKPAAPRKVAAHPKPLTARMTAQAELDFLPSAPVAPRTLKTKVEASIFCDAPVATLTHRFFAGAVDFSLILVQYTLCVSAYSTAGGELPGNRLGYGMFAVAFALIALFYGLVWSLGNVETPGMRCARLKLTNFDGFPPEPAQRTWRYFGTCLSFATCGFGLLWALADEENLAWQDHISKTFPTLHKVETSFCQGR